MSREVFLAQPTLLELEGPIKICGPVHGQYYDLLRLFEYGAFPPEANYLFLGNYVDHGKQSLETICLLLAYKIKYPMNFFLLRGGHECASVNRENGFYDECKRRYNIKLWKTFTDNFNCMPVAAIIDEKMFCMAGGLPLDLQSMEQIRRIMRPTDVPDTGLLCDLLWADPDKDFSGWGENEQGHSFTFGGEVVQKFLEKHNMDLIVRGKQVVEDGYEFFAKRQLVTLFSAPNFCGEFDNAGAIMSVDSSLMCSFQILKPAEKKSKFQYGGGVEGRRITSPRSGLYAVPTAAKTPEDPAQLIHPPVRTPQELLSAKIEALLEKRPDLRCKAPLVFAFGPEEDLDADGSRHPTPVGCAPGPAGIVRGGMLTAAGDGFAVAGDVNTDAILSELIPGPSGGTAALDAVGQKATWREKVEVLFKLMQTIHPEQEFTVVLVKGGDLADWHRDELSTRLAAAECARFKVTIFETYDAYGAWLAALETSTLLAAANPVDQTVRNAAVDRLVGKDPGFQELVRTTIRHQVLSQSAVPAAVEAATAIADRVQLFADVHASTTRSIGDAPSDSDGSISEHLAWSLGNPRTDSPHYRLALIAMPALSENTATAVWQFLLQDGAASESAVAAARIALTAREHSQAPARLTAASADLSRLIAEALFSGHPGADVEPLFDADTGTPQAAIFLPKQPLTVDPTRVQLVSIAMQALLNRQVDDAFNAWEADPSNQGKLMTALHITKSIEHHFERYLDTPVDLLQKDPELQSATVPAWFDKAVVEPATVVLHRQFNLRRREALQDSTLLDSCQAQAEKYLGADRQIYSGAKQKVEAEDESATAQLKALASTKEILISESWPLDPKTDRRVRQAVQPGMPAGATTAQLKLQAVKENAAFREIVNGIGNSTSLDVTMVVGRFDPDTGLIEKLRTGSDIAAALAAKEPIYYLGKGAYRIGQKEWIRGGVGTVCDVNRALLKATDAGHMLRGAIAIFDHEAIEIVDVKDRINMPTDGGWSDLVVLCRRKGSGGHINEVQLAPLGMLNARENMHAHEA